MGQTDLLSIPYGIPTDEIWVNSSAQGGPEYGTTNTTVRRFLNVTTKRGKAITYKDSILYGAAFVINEPGAYCVTYTDCFNGTVFFAVTLNCTQLSTAPGSLADPNQAIAFETTTGSANPSTVTTTLYLKPGDVLRAQSSGTVNTPVGFIGFRVTKVA